MFFLFCFNFKKSGVWPQNPRQVIPVAECQQKAYPEISGSSATSMQNFRMTVMLNQIQYDGMRSFAYACLSGYQLIEGCGLLLAADCLLLSVWGFAGLRNLTHTPCRLKISV